jgi:hypothetical protein
MNNGNQTPKTQNMMKMSMMMIDSFTAGLTFLNKGEVLSFFFPLEASLSKREGIIEFRISHILSLVFTCKPTYTMRTFSNIHLIHHRG